MQIEEWIWEAGKGIAIIIFWLITSYASDRRKEMKQKKHREDGSKGLSPSLECDTAVNAFLAQFLYAVKADKVKVFRFHNGGQYFNGQSIKKFSLTHLILRNGVAAPRVGDFKDLASSLFPHMLSKLLKAKNETCSWHINQAPDNYLRSLHMSEGVVFSKCIALRDTKGEMLGFLTANWITEQPSADAERKRTMIEFAEKIGNLLSLNQDVK